MASNTEPDLEEDVMEVVEQNVVDSKVSTVTFLHINGHWFRIGFFYTTRVCICVE